MRRRDETANGQTLAARDCIDGLWRVETASRAAWLSDAATYYGALRRSLLAAENQIVIAGWDIDSRTPLVGPSGEPEDDLPRSLGPFLAALADRKPGLTIHVLLWDWSMLYSTEREFFTSSAFGGVPKDRLDFCLDGTCPFGASHHQKIVVVDETVAFTGGIDLTIRRWDTPEHAYANDLRVDPAGKPYRPFHDVQSVVEGDAARAVADLLRERWMRARCAELPAARERTGTAWPTGVTPDFRDVAVGLARTDPAGGNGDGIREVETLFTRMVALAERTIYIENQFMTAPRLAGEIARRMQERPELEVLIVGPKTYASWIEAQAMGAGRVAFMKVLADAGVADRVRLTYPEVREGRKVEDVMVHAKVTVVDDRYLRIGSANLNNRSMGSDSELDLVFFADTEDERAAVRRFRDSSIGEHNGVSAAEVADAIAASGSMLRALRTIGRPAKRLRDIDDSEYSLAAARSPVTALVDPERPLNPDEMVTTVTAPKPVQRTLSNLSRVIVATVVIAALVLMWRLTPLSEYTELDKLRSIAALVEDDPLAPVYVVIAYMVLGLFAFPINLAIVVTAMTFGAAHGLAYAAVGSLASALLTYAIGRAMGRGALEKVLGSRFARLGRKVQAKGIFAVAAIRMLPIAPFTVVNLIAGASHIRVRDYALGTLLGLAPGFIVIAPLGGQIARVATDPSPTDILWLVGLSAMWLAISWGLQTMVARAAKRRAKTA